MNEVESTSETVSANASAQNVEISQNNTISKQTESEINLTSDTISEKNSDETDEVISK